MAKRKRVSSRPELTSRELEVLFLIGEGKTNAEIGKVLGCVGETVRKHCSHIYAKLNVPNRISALNRYFEGKR